MEGNPCPSCETGTLTIQKKGYGAGKGCCGTLCLGPIGLLCGAFGANKMYAVCPNCGHKKKLGKMAHVSPTSGISNGHSARLAALVNVAAAWSCHRMPSRSFHIRDEPMPVCARCLGVAIGQLIALAGIFTIGLVQPLIAMVLMALCFTDWTIQRWAGVESTNPRRLVTGLVGGYGLVAFAAWATRYVLL